MNPTQSFKPLCLLVLLTACSPEDPGTPLAQPGETSAQKVQPASQQSAPVVPLVQAAKVETQDPVAPETNVELHMLAPEDAGVWIEFQNLDRFDAVRELAEAFELALTLPNPAEIHGTLRARGTDPSKVRHDQPAAMVGHFAQDQIPSWSPILPVRDSRGFERSVRVAPGQAAPIRMGPWIALPSGGRDWKMPEDSDTDFADLPTGDVVVRVHLARLRAQGVDPRELLKEFIGADDAWFQGPQGFDAAVTASTRMDLAFWAAPLGLDLEVTFDGLAWEGINPMGSLKNMTPAPAPRVFYAQLPGEKDDPLGAFVLSCVPIVGASLGEILDGPTAITLECDPTPGACNLLLRTKGIEATPWRSQLTAAISGLAASAGTLAPTTPFEYGDAQGQFTQADLVPRGGDHEKTTRQVLVGHFGLGRARMRLASQGQNSLFTLGEQESIDSQEEHPVMGSFTQDLEQESWFVLVHEDLNHASDAPPLFRTQHLGGFWAPEGAKATSLLVQRGAWGLRYHARFER